MILASSVSLHGFSTHVLTQAKVFARLPVSKRLHDCPCFAELVENPPDEKWTRSNSHGTVKITEVTFIPVSDV